MSQTNESCTRFAKLLGIEVPFLNAPMEGIATPELVAAVSEACLLYTSDAADE